jgi:hypothetical protein
MTVVAGMLSTLFYLLLRAQFANDFVTRREHTEAMKRIGETEEAIKTMPSRGDMSRLGTQIAGVSERVAGVTSSLDGVRSGLSRIEHTQDLIMQALLEREKNP